MKPRGRNRIPRGEVDKIAPPICWNGALKQRGQTGSGRQSSRRFTPKVLKQSLGVCRPLLTGCGLLRLLNPCFYPTSGGRFKDVGAALRAFFVAAALWKAVFEKAPSTAPPPLAIFSGQSPRRQAENAAARLETPPGSAALRCCGHPGAARFRRGKAGKGSGRPPALYKRAGMRPGPVEESRPGPAPRPLRVRQGTWDALRRRSLRLSPSAPL